MYKLKDRGVLRLEDNTFIPEDTGNRHWQAYQQWLAAGNQPRSRAYLQLIDIFPTTRRTDPTITFRLEMQGNTDISFGVSRAVDNTR